MSKPPRILVVRPDRIGDTVCATPLIRALRRRWPDGWIAALVRPAVRAVLEHNPHLDTIITDDFQGADAGRAGFWRKTRELRSHRFTHALMLLPSERHTWMTFLAGIPTRVGVGIRPYHIMTFTKTVSRNKYIPLRHESDYCLDLGRAIGVQSDDLTVEAFLTDEERRAAREALIAAGLDIHKPIVAIHPQTGGSAPNWPLGRYVELVRALLDADADIQMAVNVAPSDREVRDAFLGLDLKRVAFPDKGEGLRMLMGLIAESDVAVSASTGPMHLAAALATPTVSIFCPLPACSPQLWGPHGNRSEVIVQEQQYCDSICENNPRICTLSAVSVERVAEAVLRMLRTAPPADLVS